MRTILLSQAKAGDEIASPVMNDRGMVILPQGTKLSIPLIDRMIRMGVVEVIVAGVDPNAPPPKTTEELLEELEARFEGRLGNAFMAEIKRVAQDHLLNEGGAADSN
jgi:hypothetical protein